MGQFRIVSWYPFPVSSGRKDVVSSHQLPIESLEPIHNPQFSFFKNSGRPNMDSLKKWNKNKDDGVIRDHRGYRH
jgi:hypothetical protein